uniref:Methyltransferase C9orf114 n=1 Tax=Cacopsylla melanoneura TaxID=428564 RepID=A0A8D8LF29_9HEMI
MKSTTTFTKEQQLYKARKKEQRKRKFERELDKAAAQQDKVAKSTESSETLSKEPNFDALKNVQTFSIAIPGSILDNAQSKELRTYLAGQIARTACIYKVDEVVIFYDGCEKQALDREDGISRCCVQFGRILQYLECPQYLRKYIFPIHKDLEYAGLLNPLDAPHHLREEDESLYREGITTSKASEDGTYVEIGLKRPCLIKQRIIPNVRVTLKLLPKNHDDEKRLKGAPLESVTVPQYKHGLMMFGGLQGLEAALENDENLEAESVEELVDAYINTCPSQGSRTIRTEEAVLISLARFSQHLPS